ncbi:MAG: SH3 domain-containing protein [Caldilineaceae bacterium]|nr:SH3 domain-containing protein [Caldilineaceae bacterium]
MHLTQNPFNMHKAMLPLLAAILMLLAGCAPLQPNFEQVAPAVTTEESTAVAEATPQGAINVGDAMEMGAAVATITSPSLVLRQAPNEESEVLQDLTQGDIYKVIGISTDGTWVRLEAPSASGGSGWVAARFVTVKGDITDVPITDESGEAISRPTPAPGGVVVRTDGTRLRVRAEPTTDSEIVGYVYDGEAYNVLETTADGAWARLDVAGLPDGGWVSIEFLTFPGDAVPDATAATEEESMTETPAAENPEAEATAPAAEEAATATAEPTEEATEEAAEEATTEPTQEATAESEATATPDAESAEPEATATPDAESAEPEATATPAAEAESTPEAEPTTEAELPTPNPGEAIVYTDGTRLRVRSEPTEESEIVGYVQNGEVYKILETSDDGLWVKLDIPEIEGGGWVADIYVLTAQ